MSDQTGEICMQDIENVFVMVRDGLAMHGGDIKVDRIEQETGTLFVHLTGACVGCSASDVTFQNGVEEMLLALVPGVRHVVQVKDEQAPVHAPPWGDDVTAIIV